MKSQETGGKLYGTDMQSRAHLVLWDGDCGFCGRAIAWLQRNDRQHRFQFIKYQEAPSPPMTPELYRACGQAVHVIDEQGSIRRAGRAMLFILEQEGWGPIARFLSLPPLSWLVELVYRFVATYRFWFSRFFFRPFS
jgi:predicted DCC family thiol-disulfide oxidoreductase YuxK